MSDLELLAERINAALPQTQCTQCGYSGCAPYAQAIAFEGVAINQCPPGGANGIAVLAQITGRSIEPLNPNHGIEKPLRVARIIEAQCIGCTKCIQACPVDAIVGASKWMHSILTDVCTGCELCVPPCPVDCIEMPNASRAAWQNSDAQLARARFEARQTRLIRDKNAALEKRAHKSQSKTSTQNDEPTHAKPSDTKADWVNAALARARARRTQP